ncbi:Uncharacterised protein [Chlamydia abortus]|nr:Uncharacterised protein [Chlamydia abortus]
MRLASLGAGQEKNTELDGVFSSFVEVKEEYSRACCKEGFLSVEENVSRDFCDDRLGRDEDFINIPFFANRVSEGAGLF